MWFRAAFRCSDCHKKKRSDFLRGLKTALYLFSFHNISGHSQRTLWAGVSRHDCSLTCRFDQIMAICHLTGSLVGNYLVAHEPCDRSANVTSIGSTLRLSSSGPPLLSVHLAEGAVIPNALICPVCVMTVVMLLIFKGAGSYSWCPDPYPGLCCC